MAAIKNSIGGDSIIASFEYPACPNAAPVEAWNGWVETGEEPGGGAVESQNLAADSIPDAKFEQRLAQETERAFEAGRERGREEGRRAEREAAAPAAAREAERLRHQAGELTEKFARQCEQYLHAVEQEAVRLALAVAARILRREAQMDPLLLTGAVRVALGQLAATSEIRLRVPAREADLWKETIAHLPKLAVKPVVVADDSMRLGDCAIESKVGSVDLGIRGQLGEIERGFFDRTATGGGSTPQPIAEVIEETSPVEAQR